MLIARGDRRIAGATLRWAMAHTPRAWFQILHFDGMTFDTRFVPGASNAAQPTVVYDFMVNGTWEAFGTGTTYPPRTALALTLEQLEGADRRRPYTFRASGQPYMGIEMHMETGDTRRITTLPVVMEVTPRAWDAASRVARLDASTDDELEDGLEDLMTEVTRAGYMTEESRAISCSGQGGPVARVWGALRPMIERLAIGSTLGDLSHDTGLPISRVQREMERVLVGFIGPGMRDLTRHLRIKVAVLFLSIDGASIADVAREVGYGSPAAMARAFRDAGLPAPTQVQRQVRAK